MMGFAALRPSYACYLTTAESVLLQAMKGSFQIENSIALEERAQQAIWIRGQFIFSFTPRQWCDAIDLRKIVSFKPDLFPFRLSITRKHPRSQAWLVDFSKYFIDSPDQHQEIMNNQLVPLSAAVQAAKEFLECNERPKSISWLETLRRRSS